MTIEAEDKGNPPMKSQVTLVVNIMDVNDNPPVFKRRKYQGFMNNDLTNLRNDLQVSFIKTQLIYWGVYLFLNKHSYTGWGIWSWSRGNKKQWN